MEKLIIEGTEDTPKVVLNAEEKVYALSGRSLPEDAAAFFAPVLQWLDKYNEIATSNGAMNVDLKLEYFNTASSKLILDVLSKLETIKENGAEVLVHWHYMEDDDDMKEAGEEYSELVEVPFKLISY